MATVERHLAVPPADVFAVLADGWTYSNWVVGTSHMRAVDAAWPEPGAVLHHASGTWPAVMRDETVVEAVTPGTSIALLAKLRPLGAATVLIELTAQDGGTLVTMTETPTSGVAGLLQDPLTDALLKRRNIESLARLAAIAERRTSPED